MSFTGFTQHDFDTFAIEGLDGRMAAIRERIQPKFKALGDALGSRIIRAIRNEMFLHIAKHLRRKINPPVDTWMAICPNKRGYKQVPTFKLDSSMIVFLSGLHLFTNFRIKAISQRHT